MFAVQAALMFALWLAYGAFQWQRSGRIRESLQAMCRKRKVVQGPFLLVAGALVMVGGLVFVQSMGGITIKGMHLWAWVFLSVLGLLFVHMQTLGAAMMVSLAVTKGCSSPSCNCEANGPTE